MDEINIFLTLAFDSNGKFHEKGFCYESKLNLEKNEIKIFFQVLFLVKSWYIV